MSKIFEEYRKWALSKTPSYDHGDDVHEEESTFTYELPPSPFKTVTPKDEDFPFKDYGLSQDTILEFYDKNQSERPVGYYTQSGERVNFADAISVGEIKEPFENKPGDSEYTLKDVENYMMNYLKDAGAFGDYKDLRDMYTQQAKTHYGDFYPKLVQTAEELFPNNAESQKRYIDQHKSKGTKKWGYYDKINPIMTDAIKQRMVDDNIAVMMQEQFGPELITAFQQRQMELLPGLEKFVYEGGEEKPYDDSWAGPATFENLLKYRINEASRHARGNIRSSGWPYLKVFHKKTTEIPDVDPATFQGATTSVDLPAGSINIQKRGDVVKSYDEGDHVHPHEGDDLNRLLQLHKDGVLNNVQKQKLIKLLKSDITTFKSNDPSFQKFQFNLAQQAAASGTDFYLQTDITTQEELEEARDKGIIFTQGQLVGGDDILTKEDIVKKQENPERYGPLTEEYTTRKGMLRAYKTTGEDVVINRKDYSVSGDNLLDENILWKNAYERRGVYDETDPNIAGCGDNMTCITAQTYLMNDAIDAWNKVDGNPKIQLPRGGRGVATAHPAFWGTGYYAQFGEAGMNTNDRNFLTNMYDRSSFYDRVEDEDGTIRDYANPEAIADFFKNLEPGTIMGVHGGSHRGSQSEESANMPGHAMMYAGGVRYYLGGGEYQGLDFSTKEGYEKALKFFKDQGKDLNLQNIGFLNLQDPTTNSPWQYRTENMGYDFWTKAKNIRTSTFQGNPAYRDWYKKTYTDPLMEKESILSQLTTDPSSVNSQLGTNYELFKGSEDIYSKVKEKEKEVNVNKKTDVTESGTRPTSWWLGEEGWIPDEFQAGVNRPDVVIDSQETGDVVTPSTNLDFGRKINIDKENIVDLKLNNFRKTRSYPSVTPIGGIEGGGQLGESGLGNYSFNAFGGLGVNVNPNLTFNITQGTNFGGGGYKDPNEDSGIGTYTFSNVELPKLGLRYTIPHKKR